MSDLIYYKNGEETFRISPPTVETKCPKTKLEIKKMTEIEKTEGEIKVLQAKLELLKEMENHKSRAEVAYKDWEGKYPGTEIWTSDDDMRWVSFAAGYNASQIDYKVGAYQPTPQEPEENKWKTVALRFGETLSSIGPCGYYEMTADEWLEWVNDTYEKNADELLTLVQRGIRKNEVKEYQPKEKEQKWDVVRESVKWCEEHREESVEGYLTPQGPQGPVGPGPNGVIVGYEPTPQTPDKIEENLREAFQKVQQTEEWKETQRKIDSNYDELVESETTPPEPTSTVFRQKLFDGIKSVFYDPDYERTHWKMKVDMAVDEVLTHFYDILPEPQEPICDEFVKGWNCCLAEIKMYMEFGDD
jgi:hypothetical protein